VKFCGAEVLRMAEKKPGMKRVPKMNFPSMAKRHQGCIPRTHDQNQRLAPQ
jgi:hypothetical protein